MLTRRAALAVGVLSLTGCSVDSIDSLRPAAKEPAVDHDAALVAEVRLALEAAKLRPSGPPFEPLHAAQLAALGPATRSETPPPGPTRGSPDEVKASEAALQRRLLIACHRARSGQLAMVFASMGAGIAQELAL